MTSKSCRGIMERLIQAVLKGFQWETLQVRTWGRHMRRWDNLCTGIGNKESDSAEEIKGRLRTEELIIKLWCFLCMYRYHLWVHERQIVGLEAFVGSRNFPLPHINAHAHKETQCEARRLFWRQTSPFVYVQPGVILDAFWRGFLLLSAWWKSWQSHWQNATKWWNMSLCYSEFWGSKGETDRRREILRLWLLPPPPLSF